ncbi:hypothetical protein KUTeg_022740 [Tegillarca granosa]|uniref:Uncharacterized protein n=1 Tax=Tegillarca granosa TaxID=220873 RepID=A0ABQ9E5A5_TEGGR|nr:hypothetical protein KUTeg_022740 [Tegillarca granosa]
MFQLAVIFSFAAVSSAIVCTPELCQNVKQEPLNCQGSIIQKGGFCGCTDACAKVEGELCQATYMFGIIPAGSCDKGLTCIQQSHDHIAFGRGTCVKTEPTKVKQLH